MTNEERREALAMAREKAMEHANKAEKLNEEIYSSADRKLAIMWATVAEAMKVGNATGPDAIHTEPDWTTR